MDRCNLCEGRRFKYLFKNQDRYYGIPGEFGLYRCLGCGLVFLNPQPSESELRRYYPKNYYSYSAAADKKTLWQKLLRYVREPFRIFYIMLYVKIFHFDKGLRPVPGGRILDVGCGSGDFLVKFKDKGMDCYGVEISPAAVESAKDKGIKAYLGTLNDASFEGDYFDIVVLHHVLEHLRDPMETIKEVRRILKPAGVIVIASPNIDSLCFWIFRRYWSQLDTPRHLYLFSTATLTKYLVQAGLRLKGLRCNSTPFQFTSSLICLCDALGRKRHLLKDAGVFIENSLLWFFLSPLVILCNLFKIGDSIDLVATK